MQLTFCPLFSGSSGNCAYVEAGNTRILIDAGISGKRIFEGDVVRRKIDSVESRCCYEIRWNNSFTGYWYYRCSSFMSMMNESCRVVGNIHDNPELLEETL